MLKRLSLAVLSLMAMTAVQAAEVSEQLAVSVAKQKVSGEVASVKAFDYEGQKAYYVVQFHEGGWVLVSADDMSQPVIGYSPDGYYQTENQPENFNGMMEVWSRQIVRNAKTYRSRHAGWDSESRPAAARANAATSGKIDPLISVKWNQTGSFQKYCPTNSDGQAVVGCVAVGMAQAMSVAKWPARPVGEFSYTSASFGYQYINYDQEPDYNWSAILSGANANDDVARVLWHCGVAVKMDYGVDGSGAQSAAIATALQRNFQYPASVKFYSRSGYTGSWDDLVLTELQEGRAVAYSGHDPVKNYGHCFNLDGYDGQWFHVNWGWGGANNGYFGLDGLRDAKMDMDYTDGQGVVVGVRAPSDKPSNILLSNNTILSMKPAGSTVGQVTVESEATNPTYTFKVLGEYSPLFHTNMPAPFKVENGTLVTTEQLNQADYPEGINIEITATNDQNKASVTRHFTILVTSTDGISDFTVDEAGVESETYYSASGLLLDAPQKGINVVRQKMSDGNVRSIKKILK